MLFHAITFSTISNIEFIKTKIKCQRLHDLLKLYTNAQTIVVALTLYNGVRIRMSFPFGFIRFTLFFVLAP